eukprot:161657_1
MSDSSMCSCDPYLCGSYPSHWLMFTMVVTCLTCWTLLEVMERIFGMAPKITNLSEIHDLARNDRDNPVAKYILNKRLTKTYYGNYRIQTRGTMYYIRFLWSGVMFVVAMTTILTNQEWFKNHFIYLKSDTVYLHSYQHVTAAIIAFYIFELSANRYGKITWSIIIHHWLTIIAAMQIIWGFYTPFATWYGFTIISCTFPVDFALGLRATYSNKYPEITKMGFKISFYWWLICLITNMCGQIFLIINALLPHNYNTSIHISSIIIMFFAICGWLYDDYQVLATLRDFATHDYADADILEKNHQNHTLRMKHMLGGRSLFGKGMNDEIEEHLGNELSPSSKIDTQKTKVKVLKSVTLYNLQEMKSKENTPPTDLKIELSNSNHQNQNGVDSPSSNQLFKKMSSLGTDDFNDIADIKREILQDALKTPSSQKNQSVQ